MENNIIFQITEDDLQDEAMARIGRKLNDNELHYAIKGINGGLGGITLIITYNTIFNEMIKEAQKNDS